MIQARPAHRSTRTVLRQLASSEIGLSLDGRALERAPGSPRAGSGRSSPATLRSGSAAIGPRRSAAQRGRWPRRSACASRRGRAPTSGGASRSSRPSSR